MKTITVYELHDLTDAQLKTYIEKNPETFEVGYGWAEFTLDDIKLALELSGFEGVTVGYSGFCSQGDGAHFTGDYGYKKGALSKVKNMYPQWTELQGFITELQNLESKDLYAIGFNISHRGHYQHEMATSFTFEDSRTAHGFVTDSFECERESKYIAACRKFMRHIYKSLEAEYQQLTSFEYIKESLECWDHITVSETEYRNLTE